MLAFDPGLGAEYDAALTIVSLLIAILVTGVGLYIALSNARRKTCGGDGRRCGWSRRRGDALHWHGGTGRTCEIGLVAGIGDRFDLLGIFWASLALYIACHPAFKGRWFIATVLLAIAIVLNAFHRYGCRPAVARSSTCHRCSILFSDRTVACRCRDRRNYPRHVFGGCARRKAHKDQVNEQKALLDTALASMSRDFACSMPTAASFFSIMAIQT